MTVNTVRVLRDLLNALPDEDLDREVSVSGDPWDGKLCDGTWGEVELSGEVA